ncbi:MAG: molybdopterin dinucleotide binding domain-containing protein, partial [Pseudomonadota bacterium]
HPGGKYRYNGREHTFPDIKMVWWAGGNPFHHHQDLNRLRRAFQEPETIIVNELNWTATARHSDIVLPIAGPQERTDFGAGKSDNALIPMLKAIEPVGESRTEYDIYCSLAERIGIHEAFSEGKSEMDWIRQIWKETQRNAQSANITLPEWETFIAGDIIEIPDPSPEQVFLAEFRGDPAANPLSTPSGKIELFSDMIASFGLEDCPGHATWFPPRDVERGMKKEYPLYLLSGQPGTRLHSQLDNGAFSMSRKVRGREPVLINTLDAKQRDIETGDVVELVNSRGRCLAGAVVSEDILVGCIFLWTGAWYDPDYKDPNVRDRHGNPNVLTHDLRTSSLSQGPASHSALVEVRKFFGEIPAITVHSQPELE